MYRIPESLRSRVEGILLVLEMKQQYWYYRAWRECYLYDDFIHRK